MSANSGGSGTGGSRSLVARLHAPVDIASLVFFRLAFGTILLWEVVRFLLPQPDGRSWIDGIYLTPRFQPLVDSTVDLAAWPLDQTPYSWVEPLDTLPPAFDEPITIAR